MNSSDFQFQTKKMILGDVVNFIDGDRGPNYPSEGQFFSKGDCLFLSTKNVPNNKFRFEEKQFITKEKEAVLRKGKLQRGDYVLTTRGTVGNFAYYDKKVSYEKVRINSGMVILRKKLNELDEKFFRYFLSSPSFLGQVKSRVSESAQPQLPIRDLISMQIFLPDPKNQARIASVLSTYDDLIENNEKRIKALEEMAQLLYTEWFMKFKFPGWENVRMVESGTEFGVVPEGWGVKRLDAELELAYGKALKEENRVPGNILVCGSGGIVGTHNEKLVTGPGIVVGRKGNAGVVFWVNTDFYPIDTAFFVKTKLNLTFTFYLLKTQNFVLGDAAVPGLGREQAYRNRILVPSKYLIDMFAKKVEPIRNLIGFLEKKNLELSNIRDLLIPQLVTGKRELKK